MSTYVVHFLNSNFFIGLSTILVGSFAILLYKRQKSDFKKRAAQIILLEVQTAEKRLKETRAMLEASAKAGKEELPEYMHTMPTQSWTKYNHLFVRDLLTNEWEAINTFYNKCVLIDDAIRHNDRRFGKEEQQIRQNVHRATYECAREYHEQITSAQTEQERTIAEQEFLAKRNSLNYVLTNGPYIFIYTPLKQLEDVKRCLTTVDMELSLSAVGTKLQRLAKNRYWLF